jgi:hypothetical protein
MTFGSNVNRLGSVPSGVAESIVNMQRKYTLGKEKVKKLFDLCAQDKSITLDSLSMLMAYLDQGGDFEKGVALLGDIVTIRPTIILYKKDLEKINSTIGKGRKVLSTIFFKNELIKLRDPLAEIDPSIRQIGAVRRRTQISKKDETANTESKKE